MAITALGTEKLAELQVKEFQDVVKFLPSVTIQTLALPSLPFDSFASYTPSWQEVAAFLAVLGYGVLLYSISFRWLNLFPQERELATKG